MVFIKLRDFNMLINNAKTKAIVFRRPSPKRLDINPALDGVELVENAKLFGVILQDNFSVEMHC